MTSRNVEFETLWARADKAGREAVAAMTPVPMLVGSAKSLFSNELDYSKPVEYVADGVCGFAWVMVRPGTSAFARWLKATGRAHADSYRGGVSVWVSDYNQSMQRKEAYARAMARVFADAGVRAYADSRMD